MATGCAIQPLDVTTFPSPADVQNPGFTDLFNELVGDAGTAADGFDADIETANQLLDAIDNALSELGGADGGTLDDTFEEILQFDPADAGGHVVEASAAIADAHTNVEQLGNQLAASSSPAPGGGGGGGSAPAPAAQCGTLDFGTGPTSSPVGPPTRALTIELQNTGATPLRVLSISWSPDLGFTFGVFPSIVGAVVQPGASLAVRVTAQSGSTGNFQSTLTLHTDRPDPQPCLLVRASFVLGSGGGLLPVNPIGILRG